LRARRSYRDAFDAILTGLTGEVFRVKGTVQKYLSTES
jgi:hypothetical protein